MNQQTLPDGWTENENHDLVSESGLVIPREKRSQPEIFSRVVGYMRPVSGWNKGKKAEFADRVAFVAPRIEGAEPSEGGDA